LRRGALLIRDTLVSPGLDPGIHQPSQQHFRRWIAGVEPGNDRLSLPPLFEIQI
jgi:hypothetical protein